MYVTCKHVRTKVIEGYGKGKVVPVLN